MPEETPEREHWIPTPEELEQGDLPDPRGRTKKKSTQESGPERSGLLRTFTRRMGVGKNRRYEEVGSGEADPVPAAATDLEVGETREAQDPMTSVKAARVESVRIRRPERAKTESRYQPNTKESVFYQQTEAKGHKMGRLEMESHTSYTATCSDCGHRAELVIQYDDNYANQTNWHVRGAAAERTCQK